MLEKGPLYFDYGVHNESLFIYIWNIISYLPIRIGLRTQVVVKANSYFNYAHTYGFLFGIDEAPFNKNCVVFYKK